MSAVSGRCQRIWGAVSSTIASRQNKRQGKSLDRLYERGIRQARVDGIDEWLPEPEPSKWHAIVLSWSSAGNKVDSVLGRDYTRNGSMFRAYDEARKRGWTPRRWWHFGRRPDRIIHYPPEIA